MTEPNFSEIKDAGEGMGYLDSEEMWPLDTVCGNCGFRYGTHTIGFVLSERLRALGFFCDRFMPTSRLITKEDQDADLET